MGDVTTLSLVELGVLGPLQVRQYGLPVAVPGAKPRAVLTMLGLHGGSVVTADALAELLWGARPPRTAVKALQTHISSLRRALGDGYVLTEGTGWTLSTTEIDATRYTLAARQGRDAFAGGDAGQAVARFDEALALWRGVPELPDGPRGGSEKTRWIEGHAALVEDRADALLATGRAAEIVGELEAAIADAPLRERRWSQLMLALYRAGRQGEALGAYQRARSMLADELGVDPGPDLRRLEAAIVAQDIALEIAVPEQLSVVTRAVTFLLTDIEGSTAAWEADADAMATALARHDEIVEQVVTSRGGRLVKTRGEGDATFSVFDRPSGAAAAAIELQEAIRHEPWVLAEPMRIRVALHTGEVELRDGDYFGRAVNRAARLRSLAQGGQILCSGATAELVIDTLSDDVVLADLGVRHLRNLARPEHVFEVRLETAAESEFDGAAEALPIQRPPLPAVLGGPGPFVGRGPELAGLLAAWESTLTAGAHAVLIAGEPGVGKTRLAGEWSRLAYEQGAVVLYGRCDEDLGAAYQPFAEALRSLVPSLGANRLRGLRGAEALLPLVPGLTDVVPDLPTPSRSDPDTERYALFDAVVALLAMASASAPIVLILDDLHWAAKPTLLLLRHLLRFGEHAQVQIVGTYRSTDLDRSHPLAAMLADLHRDGSATRLALGGLDEKDVTTYVTEAGYDDVELARALASVTGGNPFFLIEALRHVDESGGRWDPSTLPQGVREAVSRRLSRLPADTNKALAAAAVVGARFPLALVEQVVGEDLIDAFDEACKAGIVIEEPGGRYRFNHALVRQSLLAELASVRRMRLHQRIATTLEAEAGADDELLAELAYHYFECAWAGNAAKAVEYCRRAADQAIERLAYEGAAELYDRALHALEELDDDLPDRDSLQAELLVARCEALLAAGDVSSAVGAVSQLRRAAGDSVRLTAWGTCFGGQLSMLTDPERLDEIESEVRDAAQRLAELDDAAGEANAHTVRAACLARLGRIAESETALDQALTAARRARDHRRVNAVLAGAPLAALWGPNPVPRAGGRCLDVVRLLRITTGSPVVEATSTRCQGVLDAMRGRAAAGRQLIESARRTLTELGMRHALLEVDQFAGIVELVADDPAAAEPHLRRAYVGFRRMGLDADTAETAAFLARTCLALDRDAEADELCRESERLAGHALRPSITWRTVRAQLHARVRAHDEARQVAKEAVSIAERTDALVDHGDACLTLAMVLTMAGDTAGSRAAAEQAVVLFERKGAAALVERARSLLGTDASAVSSAPEVATVEPENECVRTLRRVEAAVVRKAWSEVEQAHAEVGSVESRRKIVGFERMILPARRMASGAEKFIRDMRAVRTRRPIVAIRGERLALTRTVVGTADDTPGAPVDEMLQLVGIDEDGRIALQVWFDIDDLEAAKAEMDAAYARFELDNACVRAFDALVAAYGREAWGEVEQAHAEVGSVESRRKLVGFNQTDLPSLDWPSESRRLAETSLQLVRYIVVAIRGERLALTRLEFGAGDDSVGAPQDPVLSLNGINEQGRFVLQMFFDIEDIDAAFDELDKRYVEGEAASRAQTWSAVVRSCIAVSRQEIPPATPDWVNVDHRKGTPFNSSDVIAVLSASRNVTPEFRCQIEAVHALSDIGAVVTCRSFGATHDGFEAEWRVVLLQTFDGDLIARNEIFDEADLDAAVARLDQLSRSAPRLNNTANQVLESYLSHYAARDWDLMSPSLADDFSAADRRRVVNSGIRHGRDNEITNLKAMVELGVADITTEPVAIRGERLVLARHSFIAPDWANFETETVDVVEIDADNNIVAEILFEADDLDSAIAELEARYCAGEAVEHAGNWSVITRAFDAVNRREIPAMTPDAVDVDHRQVARIGSGDLKAYLNVAFDDLVDSHLYVESVHRLTGVGAVVTHVAKGTSQDGLNVEWRLIDVVTIDRDLINRIEMFDEAELDAALARFDELNRPTPRLENEAVRVSDRLRTLFEARDWAALAELYAEDVSGDDHRRVIGGGPRSGRDVEIANLRAMAELNAPRIDASVLAVRGQRLALFQDRVGDGKNLIEASFLGLLEIDADGLIVALAGFDDDDLDAAFAELDARYLAGEGAENAHTWSVIMEAYGAVNRHELPAWTADTVTVDHRSTTAFAPGDLAPYLRATWAQTPDVRVDIVAVHRLTSFGAVVTHVAKGTTEQGFEGEWREITLSTVEGDRISRSEMFDEADVSAALARFDEITLPTRQLENAASRVEARAQALIAAGNWDAMSEVLADNVSIDDRRRVVNAGLRRGRDAVVEDLRVGAEIGLNHIATRAIAIRGERLTLRHIRYSGGEERPEAGVIDLVQIVEIDADERITALVLFDADDFDAALAEFDARYIRGEATDYARTWSVIAEGCATLNLKQFAATTQDYVYADRRRVANIGAGDMKEFFRAAWDLTPNLTTFVESVYKLSDGGAVVSQVAHGNSPDGFYAEWRVTNVYTVDGGLLSRCEVFDEADLDAALARYDELETPSASLANPASQVAERFWSCYEARDWDGMRETLWDGVATDDRRSVVSFDANQQGAGSVVEIMRAAPDIGVPHVTQTVLATRGERLALVHVRFTGREQEPDPFYSELLYMFEVNSDHRITAFVPFDAHADAAAHEELDNRYLAGEAATHAHAYSVIAEAFAAVNRRELPSTASDFVSIDHRRPIAFAPGDMMAYLQVTLNDAPEIRIDLETVHRLNEFGAVMSHRWHNTSQQGFDAEWRVVGVTTVEGNLINRCELYDEADLDAALARFDELTTPTPQLENAASRLTRRFQESFGAQDWDGLAEIFAEDICLHDRRRVVGASFVGRDATVANMRASAETGVKNVTSTVMATRGDRLALQRVQIAGRDQRPEAFRTDGIVITEVDAHNRIVAFIMFDVDEFDAAIAELDARYLAGEAAVHSRTWSVIKDAYAALNRHEIPPTTPDWVTVDHRRGGSAFAPGELATYIRSSWQDSPRNRIHVEAVHRLNDVGAVVTSTTRGESVTGFFAEWREVALVTVDGDLLSRTELFDEADLDTALTRFNELSGPRVLENAASRVIKRNRACFAARDWDGMRAALAADFTLDDRRRTVNGGMSHGRDSMIRDVRIAADVGFTDVAEDVVAMRGERLILTQARYSRSDEPADAFFGEVLHVFETDDADKITRTIVFDPDDFNAAFAELDARYLVGEGAAHPHIWSLVMQAYTAFNRHEFPSATKDFTSADHRRVIASAPEKMAKYVRNVWDIAPDAHAYVESAHRLNRLGAVVVVPARGKSRDGFDAEWREVHLLIFKGDLMIRLELFDEADLDAAIARFDELSAPAPRLENASTRVWQRFATVYNDRDLDGLLELHEPNAYYEDRRKGLQDEGLVEPEVARAVLFEAPPGWRVAIEPVATRGQSLSLIRGTFRDTDEPGEPSAIEVLTVAEVSNGELISYEAFFDTDDLDAAFAELDARYLAGEGAAHAQMWALVVDSYARFNRHEPPLTATDWANIDHRRVTAFEPGDLTNYVQAAFTVTPDTQAHIAAVHRLSNLGAVITASTYGTSPEGFRAEWRDIHLLTFEGDLGNRFELFDDDDLDAAIARFDELSTAPRLENAATRVLARAVDAFNRRDIEGYLATYCDQGRYDDRRKGLRDNGPIKPKFASALVLDAGAAWQEDIECIAVRGSHLMLGHVAFRDHGEVDQPVAVEALLVAEITDDELISAFVVFDCDDIDAAFAELDSRYIAGDAAEHARTWSAIANANVVFNRREMPPTTPEWINVDHRRGGMAFAPGDQTEYIRATWDVASHISNRIVAVHRLSENGAAFTQFVQATTPDGFKGEWRDVVILTVDGDMINRCEVFDEDDLDTAVSRFDELDGEGRVTVTNP
jgi:class 3 adenylate cyclase